MAERVDYESVLWSEWLESVRKDVECTFADLKNVWRILKYGVPYSDPHDVECIFKTCCIFHNMVLMYDGRSLAGWEADWEHYDPVTETFIQPISSPLPLPVDQLPENVSIAAVQQLLGTHEDGFLEMDPEVRSDHKLFRNKLRDSFAEQYRRRQVKWPRGMKNNHRRAVERIMNRVDDAF